MEELCRHEMVSAWCALCLGQVSGRHPLVEDVYVSEPFPAKYRGYCEECSEKVEIGEFVCLVKLHLDDSGIILHEDCVSRSGYCVS